MCHETGWDGTFSNGDDDAHDDDADAGEGLHSPALLRRHSRNL